MDFTVIKTYFINGYKNQMADEDSKENDPSSSNQQEEDHGSTEHAEGNPEDVDKVIYSLQILTDLLSVSNNTGCSKSIVMFSPPLPVLYLTFKEL